MCYNMDELWFCLLEMSQIGEFIDRWIVIARAWRKGEVYGVWSITEFLCRVICDIQVKVHPGAGKA